MTKKGIVTQSLRGNDRLFTKPPYLRCDMKDILFEKIYGRGTVYFIISTVIIVAFILLIIYPTYRSLDKLDMQIVGVKKRIEKQKVLLPLYYELEKKSKAIVPDKLPLPERKKFSESDIKLIPSIFKNIATKSGTEILSVNPDVTTLTDKSDVILVNAATKGDFSGLRNFLIEIGKLPYLKGIERIEIQQKGMDKELKIKMWLEMG